MSDEFELDFILYYQKLPKIYKLSYLITIIIIVIFIILFIFRYQTYYITKGKINDNQLVIAIDINDLKYLDKNILYIGDKKYSFKLTNVSKELQVDNYYHNYRYAYLEVTNLKSIDNYVYEIKIPKEKKTLAKYLKKYL